MKGLQRFLDGIEPAFRAGRPLGSFYPLYEAIDTVIRGPGKVAAGTVHVRDAIDLKRIMTVVIVALGPCFALALYNTGLQANSAIVFMSIEHVPGWRASLMTTLGISFDPTSALSNLVHGGLYFVPIYAVTMVVGGSWEVLFAIIRRKDVNEGLLVTGMLFPLTLPPTIPLWQVALGISFGVVIGKEVFGGTGKNFLNPALTARAFLFFAYPGDMTGDQIWTAVDGFSGATPLSALATADVATGMESITGVENGGLGMTWNDAFFGMIQGSMGETSTLACIFGAMVLVMTRIGSWRIMLSMLIGGVAMSGFFYLVGSSSNPMFQMPPHWHLVVGGFAFGLVFMATDPVSASMTPAGHWIYGALIGVLTMLVRVVNLAYPEGVMLAILLGNVFAPLIDYFVVCAHVRRRQRRHAT